MLATGAEGPRQSVSENFQKLSPFAQQGMGTRLSSEFRAEEGEGGEYWHLTSITCF